MDDTNKKINSHKVLGRIFMKDDPLQFLIYPLNFGMNNHIRLINVIKCAIILYLQIFNIIGVVYIGRDSRTYLRRYISGILIQQIGISSHALMVYYIRDILVLSGSVGMYFLPFDATGKKVSQELWRQCSLIRRFLYPITFILLTTAHCGLLPGVSTLGDYQFTLMFIQENFGVWSSFFQGLYYFCLLSSGHSIASLCCVSIYLAMHLKFQFHLLGSYLQQISHGIGPKNQDKLHQDIIQYKLRSFVQAHEKIMTLSTKFLDIGKWSVLVTMISTSLLGSALVHLLTVDIGAWNTLLICLGLVVAAGFSYTVATGGQQLQDESSKLYAVACQRNWNDWNIRNRKTLLMIMLGTSKTVTISSFGLFHLGNEIMLRMLKLTYSLVVLFVNLNK